MADGRWTRISDTEFERRGETWAILDDPLWDAVGLAFRSIAWVFPPITWTESEAAALDEAFLARADELLTAWVRAPYPEWYGPDDPPIREGWPGPAGAE
jgi:hypothetical protein